jgi:hypothetical protein
MPLFISENKCFLSRLIKLDTKEKKYYFVKNNKIPTLPTVILTSNTIKQTFMNE